MKRAYILRESVGPKVSQGKLEAPVLAIEDDLDRDQRIWTNWTRMWRDCSHDVGDKQTGGVRLPAGNSLEGSID